MARPFRMEYPGAVYHVTSRGNEKKPVFRDDRDRQNFLNTLRHANKRYNWICYAYCLMTDHYHLLIETHARDHAESKVPEEASLGKVVSGGHSAE